MVPANSPRTTLTLPPLRRSAAASQQTHEALWSSKRRTTSCTPSLKRE